MAHWRLQDIPWDRFDATKVDPEILRLVKAASLVENDGGDYAAYLCRVFAGDLEFQEIATRWGGEEIQHGEALASWAKLADPAFDHAAAFARFKAGFDNGLAGDLSTRGSRASEMVARCIVETGTSSYYTALGEAAEEPVLKAICQRIAADEFRHYKLFYKTLQRYLEREKLSAWGRLKIALRRLRESEDDELAYAYFAANETDAAYSRRRYSRAYARRAFALYRRHHIERGVAMVLKTAGLKPNGRLGACAASVGWKLLRVRAARLARAAA